MEQTRKLKLGVSLSCKQIIEITSIFQNFSCDQNVALSSALVAEESSLSAQC